MAKYHCTVCGYVFDEEKEGMSIDQLSRCPACKFPREKFVLYNGDEEELEEEAEEAAVYTPEPLDVSDVALSEEVYELAELIAANAHDAWAKERMDEGWEYGELESTIRKTTPLLIPYSDLSPADKDAERKAVIEDLKIIRKLGYRITREEPAPADDEELPAVYEEKLAEYEEALDKSEVKTEDGESEVKTEDSENV